MIPRDRGHLVAALKGYCSINGYLTSLTGDVFTFRYTGAAGSPEGFNIDIVPGFGLTDSDYDIDTTSRLVMVFLDRITYYPNRGVADDHEYNISRKINRCNNADDVIASQNRLMSASQNNNSSNNSTTNTDNIKHTKRMEKIIYSDSLFNRLTAAKANGSEIAIIILKELKKKHSEALGNSVNNYFDTKLYKSYGVPTKLVVTCCNKRDTDANPNHGNPQFPYLRENRTELALSSFATLFEAVNTAYNSWNANMQDYEMKLFSECMLIGEKIDFRVGSTLEDFKFAYLADNYLPAHNENTLHNSCMRDASKTEAAAQFYVLFAGAKILIGQTASGQVVSRALLWDKVVDLDADSTDNIGGFIDRVYVTHSHLYKRMHDEAYRLGYKYRKYRNTFDSQMYFWNAEQGYRVDHRVIRYVPATKWHKGGAPYVDTMCYLQYNPDDGKLFLANTCNTDGYEMYNLQSTCGAGSRYHAICPICGAVHDNGAYLCRTCERTELIPNILGGNQFRSTTLLNGVAYPRAMVKRGKLTKIAQLAESLRKIGDCIY